MSIPDKNPVPFEALSSFDKPANCEHTLRCEGSLFQGTKKTTVVVGYRRGDPTIYFQDEFSAGHYPLPQPLESLTLDELGEVFPQTNRYLITRATLFQMWNLTQPKTPKE